MKDPAYVIRLYADGTHEIFGNEDVTILSETNIAGQIRDAVRKQTLFQIKKGLENHLSKMAKEILSVRAQLEAITPESITKNQKEIGAVSGA